MPELPETETIARDLDRELRGVEIRSTEVLRADVLREATPAEVTARCTGAAIDRCWRRAKLVVIDLHTGDRIVVQPRFTGALLLDDGSLDEAERAYATVTWKLGDGRRLHYRDIRRLGTVTIMAPARWDAYSAALGIEPLDPAFTPEHLSAVLRRSGQAVKKVLMDQRVIVGIGNIYANEALWRARIDPSRAARRVGDTDGAIDALHAGITSILRESIAARGTSFRDYRDASGGRGAFVDQLAVYGRAGESCPRCGSRLVGTHAIDGRMTVLCAHCQD